MKKKHLFILIVVFFSIFSLSFLYTRSSEKKIAKKTPIPSPVPTIVIGSIKEIPSNPMYVTTPQATFLYSGPEISLPITLPVFSYQYSSSLLTKVTDYSKSLGFTSPPKQIAPGIWDFTTNQSILTYNDASKALSYNTNGDDPTKKSTFSEPQVVFDQLSQRGLFNPSISVKQEEKNSQGISEGGIAQGTRKRIESLYLIYKQIPFVFDTINAPAALFHNTDPFGISAFVVHIPPDKIISREERGIISIEQLLQLLNSGKGGLIFAADVDGKNLNSIPSYSRVEIQNISLLYLMIESEKLLVPAFRVRGIGIGEKDQTVEYFVRASS